jgi:hypothetical protein
MLHVEQPIMQIVFFPDTWVPQQILDTVYCDHWIAWVFVLIAYDYVDRSASSCPGCIKFEHVVIVNSIDP